MNEKSITITKKYDLDKPVEAVQMAVLLKNIVIQQKLYVPIKGHNYAMVEAWQLAGFLTGMNVVIEDEPKNLSTDKEIKYSAIAKVYKGDKLVSVGYAVCSGKEANKKAFDEYAILSMAQTRAIGKAYRNKIGFIMKLAGFQATPSEEMYKVGETPAEAVNVPVQKTSVKDEPIFCKGATKKGCPTGEAVSQGASNLTTKLFSKPLCKDCFKEVQTKK